MSVAPAFWLCAAKPTNVLSEELSNEYIYRETTTTRCVFIFMFRSVAFHSTTVLIQGIVSGLC